MMIDSTIFMILRKTMILQRQWLLFKERLKLKDNHSKNWELMRMDDWFWLESWKLEDSLEDNKTNLRICRQTVRTHETLKKLAYSRVYPYTHALFFKIFIVNTKYLQLVWVSLGTIVPSQADPNHTLCAGTCCAHVFKFPV